MAGIFACKNDSRADDKQQGLVTRNHCQDKMIATSPLAVASGITFV
jgi:hypothetical protein